MMSSPSAFTQRVYGVSFSVANFFARSSEARASLAMQSLLWLLLQVFVGPALVRPDRRTLVSILGWHVGRDGDALVRLHAHVDWIAGGSPQRRMRPRLQHNIAHLDVEIQVFAEEILGVHGGADDGLSVGRRRLLLGELDVLRAH